MKKLLILLIMGLAMSVQASQALWVKVDTDTPTIDKDGNPVSTLDAYFNPENELGDGPYLTYRIKVITADLQELFLPVYFDGGISEPGDMGVEVAVRDEIGELQNPQPQAPGNQFDLMGDLDDYVGSIFTMEVGLATWEDIGNDDWEMTDFSYIGYAIAQKSDLDSFVYTLGDIAPPVAGSWHPSIIVDSPVPEPSFLFLLALGACAILLKGRNGIHE